MVVTSPAVVGAKVKDRDPSPMQNKLRVTFLGIAALVSSTCVDDAYAQKPAAIEKHSRNLDVGGSKIYYEECGAGAAVVLLHDGLLHSVTWDGEWDPLCRKYHAIRYDRRGYGKSDAPKGPFSPTEDLYALLEHLKITHAVLVGSSSGAALAVDFTLAHPEMVEGLFLLGPVVEGQEVSAAFQDRRSKNNAPLANGDVKAAAENWSKDPYIVGERHDAARKRVYDVLVENPQNLRYTGEFQTPHSPSSSSRLAEIHVPTLILVGEVDISDVHASAGAIESAIPGAQRDIIINAGHLVQLEQPDILLERIFRFVDLQERKSVSLPAETLHAYMGQYNSSDGVLTIELDGDHLSAQLPGQPAFPLYAASPSKFFLKVSEIEIEFTKNAAGKVTQAIIYQDGATSRAPRM
jgi:3-oxoadipate enol-lactonase